MANLPPNSFLKPVEPVQASPYQRIDPKALGGLQPLVSDLIQTNAPKNKFLKGTYAADPNAIQSRIGEYEAYDPTQFETMAGYLSPLAAASHKGAQFFKKGSVQDALGKLTGFDANTLSQMSPLLDGLSGVGSMSGNTFYDKTALENQLKSKFGGNFAVMTPDKVRELQATMPEFGTGRFAPTYSTDKSLFYGADALRGVNELAGVYEYLKKINPLRTKTEIWKPSAEQLASRKRWDTSSLRPDPSLGYREMSMGDESIWTRQVQDTPLTYTDFMREYGVAPQGGWSDATTKGASVGKYGRPRDDLPLQKWLKDSSYLPTFSLLGSGSPEDIQRGFNLLQRMSPQNIGEFWGLAPEVQRGMLENPAAALQQMRAMANPANRDWLSVGAEGGYNNLAAYNWDPQRGLTADRSQYMNIDDSGTGLFGSIFAFADPILDKLDPLHNTGQNFITKLGGFDSQEQAFGTIMPMVVDYFLPGVGSGLSAANAASQDNWGGALAGALGAYTGMTGAGLNLTSNAALNQALTKAAITGAGTAASGGKMQDALRNAALSGLATYGGGVMGGATKNLSPLAKMAAQTAYGSGVGGLSSAIQGKGFSRGASNAARRGVTNAAINAALNSQLYKGLV